MNKRILSILLAAIMALSICAIAPLTVSAEDVGLAETGENAELAETAAQTINVTTAQINSSGFRRAVQSALDSAASNATDSNPYIVNVAAGSFVNDNVSLKIYSNTTLDLRGVTIKRQSSGNVIRVGSEEYDDYSGKSGYAYRNIKIVGGTIDGNMGVNTIVKAFHTKNFVMENVSVINEKDGHMMEVAGVDGFTLRGCTFRNQQLTPGKDGYEAVQLDVLHPYHVNGTRVEDMNMKNVLVEDCTFEDLPRGVGSHTAIHNNPHDNIVIRDCTFRNMTSIAIQGMGWTNVDIYRNMIENSPRGITVYAEPGGCTYLSSVMANKGNTTSHYSDGYKTPGKANIYIAYNTLSEIGTLDDKYASYECQGIAVLGEKLTSKSPKDNDESGNLPAGDYYIDGVDIHDNYVDVRGHGIRLEDVRNAEVIRNLVVHSKNTVHRANYYGIVLRENAQASTISSNVVLNPEVNGIQMVSSSVGTIGSNMLKNVGERGIVSYGSTVTNITNNDIRGCGDLGIYLQREDPSYGAASKVSSIKYNRIKDCSDNSVYIAQYCSGGTITGNTVINSGSMANRGSASISGNYTQTSSLSSFTLPQKGVKMRYGTRYLIVPDTSPVNAIATFTYTSADPSIAYINSSGMIYARKTGTTSIKVTSNNGISRNYRVEVVSSGGVSYLTEDELATPQITSLTSDEDGITIKWDPVTGAAGYRVYYMTSDGWKRFASDVSGTTKLDTGVSYGRKETYTVRALSSSGEVASDYNHSGWSTTYGVSTPQITSLSSDEDGITIKWSAVSGASTYRVYYMTSDGWKRFATDVKGTTKLDTGVSYGRQEQYTVRAINKKGDVMSGYKSDGWKTTYGVATPQITNLENTADGIRITWSSVPGISTYRVYYKTASGDWKRFGTDTKGLTRMDTGVLEGRAETYTVRALDTKGNPISDYYRPGWTIIYSYSDELLAE